ncbi:bacteriophage T4 gp5 trimerisation domain-containing protein, partial [Burkholderia aenigmatica]
QVTIGRDRRHDIGQDDFLAIGRNHTITTAKDRTEEVGNHRRDKTAANHTVEIGGHYEQRVQGRIDVEAGLAITTRTKVIELQAGDVFRLRGPGGTITLDDCGVELEGVAIRMKGPMTQNSSGAGQVFSLSSASLLGDTPDDAFHLTFSGDA